MKNLKYIVLILFTAIFLGSCHTDQTTGLVPPVKTGPFYFNGVDAKSEPLMKEAEERIEKIRKGDFNILLTDAMGTPIKKSKAEISLIRHKFKFGMNIRYVLNSDTTIDKSFQVKCLEVVEELYNMTVVGNHWQDAEPKLGESDWSGVTEQVEWALERGIETRWHSIVYNCSFAAPLWGKEIKTEEEWWPLIERRIQLMAEKFGSRVHEYDVINEMFVHLEWAAKNNPTFPPLYEPKNGARIFELARKYLPDAILVSLQDLPDDELVSLMGLKEPKYLPYQKTLIDMGAPVDVLGFQGHYFYPRRGWMKENYPLEDITMKKLVKVYDELAELGKPIHITEFGPPALVKAIPDTSKVPYLTEQALADWTVNFYTLMFSKPYINQITAWHLTDGNDNPLNAGILTKDGTKKLSYYAMKKLLKETWSTQWKGKTKKGIVSFRGFYGTYELQVKGYKPVQINLLSDGESPVVQLEALEN